MSTWEMFCNGFWLLMAFLVTAFTTKVGKFIFVAVMILLGLKFL
jgi:hypothetical protein